MNGEELARIRDLLERVSRVVESNAGSNAPTLRTRARVKRKAGDMALGLLLRGGFIESRRVNAEDVYYSVTPYRVSNEAPRAAFTDTHAARQGGAG